MRSCVDNKKGKEYPVISLGGDMLLHNWFTVFGLLLMGMGFSLFFVSMAAVFLFSDWSN